MTVISTSHIYPIATRIFRVVYWLFETVYISIMSIERNGSRHSLFSQANGSKRRDELVFDRRGRGGHELQVFPIISRSCCLHLFFNL